MKIGFDKLAVDKSSARTVDTNGFMHVAFHHPWVQ